MMRFHRFRDAVLNKISIKRRLQIVCLRYLISLMAETRKHSLTFAAGLSETDISAFSRFLLNNKNVIKYTLRDLSKKQAKIYSQFLKKVNGLRWRVFIIIDSTVQDRAGLKSENVQKFNHGKGCVIGHQRTNILLFFNGIIIPLPPIPFYTKKYCRENGLPYVTEHDRVAAYLSELNMYEYIGLHNDEDIAVLTGSGYDNKKIQNAVLNRKWHFISALKSSRGVKSEAKYAKTPKSSGWDRIGVFFKKYRKLAWQTVRIFTDGPKRKRKDFRIRHTEIFLKGVGKITAVCSEIKKKKSGGCRKYIACSDLKATPRQILIAYRLRWKIEIFHKHVKMHLGFGDIAPKHFSSAESHVYLVYSAYILLQSDLPGIGKSCAIPEKQRKIANILENKKTASIIHELTKMGGTERYKNELKKVLAS
jgi:hypothetical protein